MTDLAKEFLETHPNLVASTRVFYARLLRRFLTWCKDDVINTDTEKLNAFIQYLRNDRKLRKGSVLDYLKVVKPFLLFLERKGLRQKQTIGPLARIPQDQIKRPTFTYEQYLAVLDESLNAKRHRQHWPSAIIIGWNTGLRLGDTCCLRWDAVEWDSNLLRVRPKKMRRFKQELEIPIEPELQEHLSFLWEQHKQRDSKSPHILPDMAGMFSWDSIGEAMIKMQFKSICNWAGVPNGFHCFRRALVTRLLNAGVDAKVIGSITGQSLNTVYMYATSISLKAKQNGLAKARQALHEARMQDLKIETPV